MKKKINHLLPTHKKHLGIFYCAKEMSAKGFSLLEVVVSFSLLTMGIVAVLTLLNQSIAVNRESPNRLIAASLANDALELVRNVRDNNIRNGLPWDDDIPPQPNGCNGSTHFCVVGYKKNCVESSNCTALDNCNPLFELTSVPASQNLDVKYNDLLGYFQVDPNPGPGICTDWSTLFVRKVIIDDSPPNSILITVIVEWSDPRPQSLTVTEEIFNI